MSELSSHAREKNNRLVIGVREVTFDTMHVAWCVGRLSFSIESRGDMRSTSRITNSENAFFS